MIEVRYQADSSGRSMNLAMSNRGWKALDGVGISDSVHEIAIPWTNALFTWSTSLTFKIMVKKVKVFILFLEGVE
jgi:hypothetical protein